MKVSDLPLVIKILQRGAGDCGVVFEAEEKNSEAKKKKIFLALTRIQGFLFSSLFFSFFFIRIPGWKNLTTVDKAIHINAKRSERKRARDLVGWLRNFKKVFLCVIVRTC